jgi:hypothetical protein
VTPLLFAICAWGIVIWVAEQDATHLEAHAAKDDLVAIAGAAALALTIVGLALTVRNAWRTRSAIRQERHAELAQQRYEAECAAGLRNAQSLATQLLAGHRPEPLTVWGLVLRPGETARFDLTADYSRLISMNGHEAWTEPQNVRVIATDRRLLCDTGRWLSFWYHDITGFYPDLRCWSVVMDFDDTAPMALRGADTPVITVCAAERLYGPDFSRQPELVNPKR